MINQIAAEIGEWRRGKGFVTPTSIQGSAVHKEMHAASRAAFEICDTYSSLNILDVQGIAEIIDKHIKGKFSTDAEQMLGKLMLVVTELAEAAEAVRKGDIDNFSEEIADTFIRAMDITDATGIDIEDEIEQKMAVNQKRPYRHGTKVSL